MNELMKEAIDKCRNAHWKKEMLRLRKEVDYYKKREFIANTLFLMLIFKSFL